MMPPGIVSKWAFGTAAARDGSSRNSTVVADWNSQKYQRCPTLPSISSKTRQPVSSACQRFSVCCWSQIAETSGENSGARVRKPPVTVPAANGKSWPLRLCSRRLVGLAYRNLSNRISTHSEIPYLPLAISRFGAGAVTMPATLPQLQPAW